MRRLLLTPIAATLLLAMTCQGESSAPVFKEDFAPPTYTEGTPIPTGPGILQHGQWQPLGKGHYPAIMQVEDDSPCAVLHVPHSEQKGNASRLIGTFGREPAPAPIAGGLRFSLNFKCSAPMDESFHIQIMGSDGKSRANVSMSAGGRPTFSFGGKRIEPEIPFEAGRWYTIVLTMPTSPQTLSTYTAALYEKGAATPLVEQSGRVSRSVEEGGDRYVGFEVIHRIPGETLYVDDIEVTSTE